MWIKDVIPIEKSTLYTLNPRKDVDKDYAFELVLGYNISNDQKLMDSIMDNLHNFPAKPKGNDGFGAIYGVVLVVTGENGKNANVLTGWIDNCSH